MNTITKLPAPGQRTDEDWASEGAKVDAVLYTTVRVDRIIATTHWHAVADGFGAEPEWVLEVTSLLDLRSDMRYRERFPGTAEGYKSALKFHRDCVKEVAGGGIWNGER